MTKQGEANQGVEVASKGVRDGTPAEDDGLVPAALTQEAEAARQAVLFSLIPPAGRRAVAVFLGTDEYRKVRRTCGSVLACLMLESLVSLIRDIGGEVVLSRLFLGDGVQEVLNAIEHTVQVDGEVRHILDVGHLFIHLPNERIVISTESNDRGHHVEYHITVRSNKDSATFLSGWENYTRQHNYLRGQVFYADGEIIERSRRYTWDDIILPAAVRDAIETHVLGFLRKRRRLRALGVKGRRGLILEGPPGTGKTLLGKVLADALGASFMWVLPRHVQTAACFADMMDLARFVAPTVLFLEDLDLYAEDRERRGWIGLGELMNQLDGCVDNEDIVTIATTNRLDTVEKALRNRPGRFDRVLRLDALDAPCRRRMLERLLARASIAGEDLEELVTATDGYTGAQVEELANTLYILAVEKDTDAPGGDGRPPTVSLDKSIIAAALDEFRVELAGRMGFLNGRQNHDRVQ